jgi:hypothetical protein
MKLTRQTLSNIAIAAVAILLFAGFVSLATKGGGKNNDKLSAVAPTSTTRRVTTTTEETTTTLAPATTTTALLTTTTVATTATTRASTTGTTAKKTTTTAAPTFTCPARAAQSTTPTDNSAAFTHNPDGSFVASSTQPNSPDPILFTIAINQGSDAPSGDTASVQFVLTMENKSPNHCVYFANDDANMIVTLQPSGGGTPIQFAVPAGHQDPLRPGDKLTAKQTRGVSGYGTFTATATCDVNYS